MGIKTQGKKYFKGYLHPNPIFLPINLIGEFAKPLSLSFRLFGNILGGLIILQLMYSMLPLAFRFVLPNIGHIYFDLFAGALQAFVFTMLSLTFIYQKAGSD
jgi:F-type H+-transporting ATPase subunit a